MAKLWYLSPSDQDRNIGINGYGSEMDQMNLLMDAVTPHLDRCGVRYFRAAKTTPIDDRPQQANEMKADYYLALHSNAGGGGGAWGPIAFYHTSGKALAEKLIRELKATGQQSNRASSVQSRPGLFELQAPEAVACLLEVDFHDSAVGVQFLTERRADAARAIAKAVVAEDGRTWVPEQPLDPKEQAVRLGLFPKDTDWAGALIRQEAAQLAIRLKDLIERV